MTPLFPLRSRSAVWFLLPALLFVVLYAGAYVNLADSSGYWTAVTASSAIFLFISCAPAGASAAIEGSRARRGRITEIAPGRSEPVLIVQHIWPSYVLGLSVQAAAFLLVARTTWGAPGAFRVDIFAGFAAIILLHTAMGYALGRRLPIAVSIPLSVLLSYVWLGFTWSTPYFPLRYLAGLAISGCCRADETLDSRALVAATLFSVGAAMALLISAAIKWRTGHQSHRIIGGGAALVLLAGATVSGLSAARDLGPFPVTTRSAAELTCEGSQPEVCIYPEQDRASARQVLVQAYTNLAHDGLKLPPRMTASPAASDASSLNMALRTDSSSDEIVYSLATAFLSPQLYAECSDGFEARGTNVNVIVSWLTSRASRDIPGASGVPFGQFGEGLDASHELQSLATPRQVAWIDYNLRALTDCSMEPTQLPSL